LRTCGWGSIFFERRTGFALKKAVGGVFFLLTCGDG
jgi:hypothetical protein